MSLPKSLLNVNYIFLGIFVLLKVGCKQRYFQLINNSNAYNHVTLNYVWV